MSRPVAIGAAVFLVMLGRSLSGGFGLADESWFLQVVARMQAGDVLYRDVFLGTTPLSVYVTWALAQVVGIEIVAVKLVTNASAAASAAIAFVIARRAGVSGLTCLAVPAAVVVWGRPYSNPPYTAMAMMLFVAAIAAAPGPLRRDARAGGGSWLLSGILAGLSFGAKQNVGLLALAAVGIVWWATKRMPASRRDAVSDGTRLVGGFVGAVALVLAPVLSSGGFAALWDFGFASKGRYLELGGVSYLGQLGRWLAALSSPRSLADAGVGLHGLVLALPAVLLLACGLSARRLDRLAWTMTMVAMVATLSAFPRWDRFHMTYAVPMLAVALAIVGSARPGGSARRTTTVVASATVGAAVVLALQPLTIVARGHYSASSITHFRGPLVTPAWAAELASAAGRIREAAAGEPVLLLSPEAGFWYLTSGTVNPTPFDMPMATALGTTGLAWLGARLDAGQIAQACLDRRQSGALVLSAIASQLEATFERGPDVGPCVWYRRSGR